MFFLFVKTFMHGQKLNSYDYLIKGRKVKNKFENTLTMRLNATENKSVTLKDRKKQQTLTFVSNIITAKNSFMVFCVYVTNRPFPSPCLPPLQSESKCEVFVMVISSTLHMNEN